MTGYLLKSTRIEPSPTARRSSLDAIRVSPDATNGGTSSSQRLWVLLAMGVLLGTGAVLILCQVPPLQDFDDWIYQSFLFNRLLAHAAGLPAALKSWPVPNTMSQLIMSGLMLGLAPIAAAKTFLLAYLAAGSFVLWRISRAHQPESAGLIFLVSLPLALINSPFWTGELNYQLGLICLLGYLLNRDPRRDHPATILFFSIFLFFCHALCFGLFFLSIVLGNLLTPRRWTRIAALIPSGLLTLWYLARDPRLDDAKTFAPALHGIKDWFTYRIYVFSKLGTYHNFVFDGRGDFLRETWLYWLGIAVNLVALVCIFWLIVVYLRTTYRAQVRSRSFDAIFAIVVLCVVLAILDPAALLHNANTGERLLLPAACIAVLQSRRALRVKKVYGAASAIALFYLVFAAIHLQGSARARTEPSIAEVNQHSMRMRLLYWIRPFGFAPETLYAEDSAAHQAEGQAPEIGFQTGLLVRSSARH